MRRLVDPSDGRFTLATLTDEGHEQVTRSTPAHHALVEQLVFDPLTEEQVRQLADIARRIVSTIDPAPAWSPPRPES